MDALRLNIFVNFVRIFIRHSERSKKFLQWLIFAFGVLVTAASLTACSPASMMSNWPGAAIKDGVVYVAYQAHVYALQAKNGSEIWRFPQEVDNKISFYASPALSPEGDQLIVGGFHHILYSLNPSNGSEQWRFEESKYPFIASPLVTEDSIYAPTNGNLLYALDRKGNKRWEFKTEAPIWATPVYDTNCACIYVACLDHYLYALQTQDGALLWKTDRLEGAIASAPVLSNEGILYFGTFGNLFHAFDLRTRKDIWTYKASQWVWGSPILIEDQIILTDLAGNVIALDSKSGAERWKIPTGAAITASPTFHNGVIYIGNEAGDLYAIDTKGNLIWQQPKKFDGKILSAALTADEVILIPLIAKDNLIVALNLDGGQSWSYQPVK
ncbi:MAG: PQQ-binding-like beta-propeller repeat protein [Anaerolineales bacterium]|nr:PQQ-binding-like beta-propeller repeat protein [Anaerolineales bacterium]